MAVPSGWGVVVVHRSDRLDSTFGVVPVAVDGHRPAGVRYHQHRAVALAPGEHRLQVLGHRPLSAVLSVSVSLGCAVHVVLRLSSAVPSPPQVAFSEEGWRWALVVVDAPLPPCASR